MRIGPGARIAVSGSTGFLGSALAASLEADGASVHRMVRKPPTSPGDIHWDPASSFIDLDAMEGLDAVVNLAGESIAGVWTPARKNRIFESRSAGTRLIAATLGQLARPPEVLVSASAVGYYGDAGEATLTEDDPPGDDFLARVCIAWEHATASAVRAGIRVVNPRFGLILDPAGGALAMLLPAFRLGLGARLGSGRQWMSWISLEDAVGALRLLLESPHIEGPVNAVAPEPVRNADFTAGIARALHRPAFLGVPRIALKAATGGMADALLLTSQRVVPEVLMENDFPFRHPDIDAFLRSGLDAAP